MGYTREQLEAAGFKPEPAAQPKRLTREQLEAMGFKPVEDPMSSQSVDLSQPYDPRINPARAAILGASQGGTLGFGEEIGAGVASQSPTLRPNPGGVRLGAAFAPSPDDTPEIRQIKREAIDRAISTPDPLAYEPLRDLMRAELAQAQQQEPLNYAAGEMAGSLMTAALPGGQPNMGGSVLRNAMRLVGSGAGAGAAAGVGASNAPLDSPETASAAGKGAAAGLGGALAGAAVGKGAPLLLRALGRGAEGGAVNAARRVMLSGAKQLGDKGRVKMPDAVPLQALKSGAIVPFGTTEGTLGRLTAARQAQSKTYGEIVESLEKAGVDGPDARLLARDLMLRSAEIRPRTSNDAIPDLYLTEAEMVVRKAQEGAQAGIAKKGRLGLSQAEDIKRSLQDEATYGKIEDTPLNEAREDIAAVVREATERSVMEGAKRASGREMLEAAESFIPVKQKLGRLIEAEKAARQGVQRASTRGSASMPGPFEVGLSAATGSALPMAAKVGLGIAKNRGPSTMAATLYPLSRGLQGAGNLMSRVPVAARMAGGAGLGAAAGRALAMEPEQPLPPEPPDMDLERWRLEQELRGQSRPSGAPLRRLVTKGRK